MIHLALLIVSTMIVGCFALLVCSLILSAITFAGTVVVTTIPSLLRGLCYVLLLPLLAPIGLALYCWQHKAHAAVLLALVGALVLMQYYGIGSVPRH